MTSYVIGDLANRIVARLLWRDASDGFVIHQTQRRLPYQGDSFGGIRRLDRGDALAEVGVNRRDGSRDHYRTPAAASFTSHREAVGETCDASGMGAGTAEGTTVPAVPDVRGVTLASRPGTRA